MLFSFDFSTFPLYSMFQYLFFHYATKAAHEALLGQDMRSSFSKQASRASKAGFIIDPVCVPPTMTLEEL